MTPLPTPLTPDAVMAQIVAALPADCRQDVIVIGSLAAGYHFFAGDGQRGIRTKDVDCMFSPYARAVAAAGEVTERLLAAAWQPRTEGEWGKPGDSDTPDDRLPMIRLKPPGADGATTWFLELLGAPEQGSEQPKVFHRVQTSIGHFAICSFHFLALAEWKPILTQHGLHIARPEMKPPSSLRSLPPEGALRSFGTAGRT